MSTPYTVLRATSDPTDTRVVCRGGYFARQFDFGGLGWTTLRIIGRGGWTTNYDTSPSMGAGTCFALGLCSGIDNIPGDATVDHALGFCNATSSFPGGNAWATAVSYAYNGVFYKAIWEGTNYTYSGSYYFNTVQYQSCGFDERPGNYNHVNVWMLEFTRGATWSSKMMYTNTSGSRNISRVDFDAQKFRATPTFTHHVIGTASGYPAPDEGTYGALNSVFFYNNNGATGWEWLELEVIRIA